MRLYPCGPNGNYTQWWSSKVFLCIYIDIYNFAIIDIAPYTKEQKNQQPSGPSIACRYISLLAGYATGSRPDVY